MSLKANPKSGIVEKSGVSTLQQIQKLSLALQQAVNAKEWSRVQQVDKTIVRWLTLLKKRPCTVEEQRAIEQLKKNYQQNYQRCLHYRAQLQQKMLQYRRNGEGLHAYALFALDELES